VDRKQGGEEELAKARFPRTRAFKIIDLITFNYQHSENIGEEYQQSVSYSNHIYKTLRSNLPI
jgi:hypothetical protein